MDLDKCCSPHFTFFPQTDANNVLNTALYALGLLVLLFVCWLRSVKNGSHLVVTQKHRAFTPACTE